MRIRIRRDRVLRLAAVASLVLAAALPARADETRGCAAQWEVRYARTEVDGRLQNPAVRSFGRFESRGRCRSRVYANDCRRQARGYAQDCFRDHWNRRWDEAIREGDRTPPECVGGRGGVGVVNYDVDDLKEQIERHACAFQVATPFRVHVVGRTWGDDRCAGEVVVTRNYVIKDEMCGKR